MILIPIIGVEFEERWHQGDIAWVEMMDVGDLLAGVCW